MEEFENQNTEVQNPTQPVVENTPQATTSTPCHPHGKMHAFFGALNILMFLGLIGIYILHFTSKGNTSSKANPDATPAVVNEDGVLKIAYVNTDTLMAKYQYAIDLQDEIQKYQSAKESNYKQQMEKFQSDYQNYLKTGADLTLSQQKSKEEELKKRAEKLQSLEGEYAVQIQQKTLAESEKMTRAVYNFIREYNKDNQQFDLILARSFSQSPILYGNPGMDITNEIIEGLNKDYAKSKEK